MITQEKTFTQEQRDKVHDLVEELEEKGERVSIDNFVRFSSIHEPVYVALMGREPYAITVRRAFNRHRKIGIEDENPDYYAHVIASSIANDLDPTYEWLEYA